MIYRRFMGSCALLFFGLLVLGGCGDSNLFSGMADTNTSAAKLDRGVAALSTGEWDLAVDLLEDLYAKNPNDPAIKKYLASAYVGKAGFDTLTLITEIAKAQETKKEGSILFDSVLGIFSDAEGDLGDLDARIALVGNALTVLCALDDGGEINPDAMSKEQKTQAGLYASVQTILLTATVLEVQNTAELDALEDAQIDTLVRTNFAENKDELERSLTIVTVARDALIDSFAGDGRDKNDIGEEFDIFIEEIGFDDGVLDEDDLIAYLQMTL